MTSKAIDYFHLQHPARKTASSVSRVARESMFAFFMKIMRPTPESRIIDVGVTPDESLPDSNVFESLYPYKHRITATSIEDASHIRRLYPGVEFVRTERFDLPFQAGSFEIAFCSAVLEHVGDTHQQERFLKEILRVSKRFFIVTPNRQFPLELHTLLPVLHWLPRSSHQSLLRRLGFDFWAKSDNLTLLTPGEARKLLKPWTHQLIVKVHFLLGLPSNIILYGRSGSP